MKAAVVLAGVLLAVLPVKAAPAGVFDLEKMIDQADFVGVVDTVGDPVHDYGGERTEIPLLVKQRLRGPVTSPEIHLVTHWENPHTLVGEWGTEITLLAFLKATDEEGGWVVADPWGLVRISAAAPAIVPGDGADNDVLAAACMNYIRASLKDPDVAVQRSALEALLGLGLRVGEAGPEVVRLSHSQDPIVAARSLTVRMRSGDLDALPRAIEMIETPGLLADREVLHLTAAIAYEPSLPVAQLNQLLMTVENPLLRKRVAGGIVGRRDESSLEALIQCLSFPDPDMNRICVGGLEIITRGKVSEEWHQDAPAAIRAWQAWWEEHKAKD